MSSKIFKNLYRIILYTFKRLELIIESASKFRNHTNVLIAGIAIVLHSLILVGIASRGRLFQVTIVLG